MLNPPQQLIFGSGLEDILGTYLVKLTSTQLGDGESVKATEYMKMIGDYERIADHCSNISGCVLDTAINTMNIHQNQRLLRNSGDVYDRELEELRSIYTV